MCIIYIYIKSAKEEGKKDERREIMVWKKSKKLKMRKIAGKKCRGMKTRRIR
jgi:hypothetical protein